MNWDNADTDNGTKAILIQKEAQRECQREESRRILEAFEGGGGATEEEAAKFDKQLALLSNGATPTILAFDPFREHHLIVADLRNRIRYTLIILICIEFVVFGIGRPIPRQVSLSMGTQRGLVMFVCSVLWRLLPPTWL